jgi:NADH dehydrogenase
MKARHIVVLGGTGFIGSHLVPRLHADGHAITVLSRNRDRHPALRVLPRVRVVTADVHDPATLRRRLEGADAAINLVGILNEPDREGRDFMQVHVALAASLVAACVDAGVPRLLQMSALRAGEGSSRYLASRAEAEQVVRRSPLAWTIFRPSVVFGAGDGLFFRFASLLRLMPVLPLARADARFAPVFAGDVAEAFARALVHPLSIGRTCELAGPDIVTLAELVRWTARLCGRRRLVLPLPDALGYLQAWVGEWLPGKPITRDNFRSLQLDSVAAEDGLAALGIIATPMRTVMPALLASDQRRRIDRRARHG